MSVSQGENRGREYNFWAPEAAAPKRRAMELCGKLNQLRRHSDPESLAAADEVVKELFGNIGASPWVGSNFQCDNGINIHAGDFFLANCNVVILDVAEVKIGDYCMIGPNTVIAAANHPLSPKKRREHIGLAQPVTIGDDVWIGANCSILPGVTIGNNVVVAAGAVVTADVPDNCLVGGCPAKVIKILADDINR